MRLGFLAATAATLAFAQPAGAAVHYSLDIFYHPQPGYTYPLPPQLKAEFVLPDRPTPDAYWDGSSFNLDDIEVTYSDGRVERNLIRFYDEASGGGVEVFPSFFSVFSVASPVLFTGPRTAPVLHTAGSYANVPDYSDPDNLSYSLVITYVEDATAVPEPASWAMMIAGFGLVGAALRARGAAATGRISARA